MKFSVSITSNENTVRLALETAGTSFLGETISKELERRGIEIVEVVLDREVGKGNPPRSLDCQFSEQVIARNHLVFQFSVFFYPFVSTLQINKFTNSIGNGINNVKFSHSLFLSRIQ